MKNILNSLLPASVLLLLFTGCYYDVEEELYPAGTCDTSGVSYTTAIVPLINQYCISCHSGTAPSGNIDLSDYTNVKLYVDDGSFYGSISHNANWSAMPQGGNKLDDCTLLKVQTWINNGSPN